MKKTYINPEIQVVMIATQQMLAASEIPGGGNTDQNLGHEDEFDFNFE